LTTSEVRELVVDALLIDARLAEGIKNEPTAAQERETIGFFGNISRCSIRRA
jgi:hypothetical protein